MEIFTPDGTSAFINQAGLKFNKIRDPRRIIGKHNLLEDPVYNEQLGLRKKIKEAFKGRASVTNNTDLPVTHPAKRGAALKTDTDYYLYPVKSGGKQPAFVAFICIPKK
jgi:hypothetical protein